MKQELKPYFYPAKVLEVIDGDTLKLDVDVGFHFHVHEHFRLYGINCGEKFGIQKEQGIEAKNFVSEWALQQASIWVTVHKSPDKYGRWLAEVYGPTQEEKLNDLLLKNHLAVEYYGEARNLKERLDL